MSISNYLEKKWLDMIGGVAYAAPSNTYLKLHLGDPGEDGTLNPAANSVRQVVLWATASSPAGTIATSGAVTWSNVPNAESYSHWTLWDSVGPTGGNCLWIGALSSVAAVQIGDTFQITNLTLTLE